MSSSLPPPPRSLILTQVNLVHIATSSFLKISFMLFPHLCLGLQNNLFHFSSSNKILYVFVAFLVRATCPAHLTFLVLITIIITGEK
jgi:hypothetical protein